MEHFSSRRAARRNRSQVPLDEEIERVLPIEILQMIFSFLPYRERQRICSVCRRWSTAIYNSPLAKDFCLRYDVNVLASPHSLLITSGRSFHNVRLLMGNGVAPSPIASFSEMQRVLDILLIRRTLQCLQIEGEPNIDLYEVFSGAQEVLATIKTLEVKAHLTSRRYTNLRPEITVSMPKLQTLVWDYCANDRTAAIRHSKFNFEIPQATHVTIRRQASCRGGEKQLAITDCDRLQRLVVSSLDLVDGNFFESAQLSFQELEMTEPLSSSSLTEVHSFYRNIPNLRKLALPVKDDLDTIASVLRLTRCLTELTLTVSNFHFSEIIRSLEELVALEVFKIEYSCSIAFEGAEQTVVLPRLKQFQCKYTSLRANGEVITIFPAPQLREFHLFAPNWEMSNDLNNFRLKVGDYLQLQRLTIYMIPEYQHFLLTQRFSSLTSLNIILGELEPEMLDCWDTRFTQLRELAVTFSGRDGHFRLLTVISSYQRLYRLELRNFILPYRSLKSLSEALLLKELHLYDGIIFSASRQMVFERLTRLVVSCVAVGEDDLDEFCIKSGQTYRRYKIKRISYNGCQEYSKDLTGPQHMDCKMVQRARGTLY